MTPKSFYKLLAILLGYALIIAGFVVLGAPLSDKVRILDIVVSCVIFTQFVLFTLFPMINLDDPSHKEVGMMGIHLLVVTVCSILAIVLMWVGIAYHWSFRFQLIGQLVILFIMLVGRVSTLYSGEKVQQIYEKEQVIMSGKASLKKTMEDFMEYLANIKDMDSVLVQKISTINESMRFISPSAKAEACELDTQFCQLLEDIKVFMKNPSVNGSNIADAVTRMERILARRKKY